MNPGSNGRIARGDFYYCTLLDDNNNCNTDPKAYQPLYGAPATPPARRLYRGIELTARKSFSDRFWLQASYVFSSLRGNYDGEVQERYSATEPGLNGDFGAQALGHNNYGRLYLDRPQDLRFSGFYVTPLKLSVGFEAWLASGPPLEKIGYFCCNWSAVQLVPRGYAGRLPTQWDANLSLEYPIAFGPVTVTLRGNVYNVFNNQIATSQDVVWSDRQPDPPYTIYDADQPQTHQDYGKITARRDPRLFRAAIRVSF